MELTLLVLGEEDAFATAVADVLVAQLPGATCRRMNPALMRSAPDATAIVIDARSDAQAGADHARRLRALGFAGALTLVGGDAAAAGARAERDGFAVVAPDQMANQLLAQVTEAMVRAGSPYAPQVARARRLVAAGEIAARLQHALNNPLTGLLAEAQLLQLEQLAAGQAEALERMVGHCRRMMELTRTLDGLADRSRTS